MHNHKHSKRKWNKSHSSGHANGGCQMEGARLRTAHFRSEHQLVNKNHNHAADEMDKCVLVSSCLAFVLYMNTIPADFAYDDSRAILKNPDLLSETPVTQIFYDDFWGTPLTHSGSHKSYRPLTVLTFRLNYLLGGHHPVGYHLLNVVLHAAATGLFTHLARVLIQQTFPVLAAGLLFASHPIHTEAVAGVVGRADILACIFFLLAFLSYIKYCKYRDKSLTPLWPARTISCSSSSSSSSHNGCNEQPSYTPNAINTHNTHSTDTEYSLLWKYPLLWKRVHLLLTSVFTVCALLSKEQGVTVLAVCLVYDVLLHSGLQISAAHARKLLTGSARRGTLEGVLSLTTMALVFVSCRVYFMGSRPPEFAPADNPASDSPDLLTRTLTFAYLPLLNFWLLLFPKTLSFDWSMEAVPLVESIHDSRNVCIFAFYAVLGYSVLCICQNLNSDTYLSTNTVPSTQYSPSVRTVRERLYSNHSPGAVNSNHNNSNGKHYGHYNGSASTSSVFNYSNKNGFVLNGSPYSAISTTSHFTSQSMTSRRRNTSRRGSTSSDSSEDSISGTASQNGGQFSNSPPQCYTTWQVLVISLSIVIIPFIPATNLFFYVGFVVAERVLYIPSMGFILLVAYGAHVLMTSSQTARRMRAVKLIMAGLVIGYSLRTVIRNEDWRTEENLYRSGIAVNPAKAWGNLANILNAQGKTGEAEQAYRSALHHRANMADVHYNLGILLQDQQRYAEAIDSYQMAIQCRPRLTMAHLNLGIVMSTIGRKEEAEKIYRHCAEIDTAGLKDPRLHENTKISALYNLGRLLADQERFKEAVEVYKAAIIRRPSHYAPQSLYNMLGEAYSKLDQLSEAETWYLQALKVKPDHIPAHLTMAKLKHKRGKVEEAENWFLKAKQLDPKDSSVYQHYGQFLGEVGRHAEAAENYARAAQLVPTDFELVFNTANAMRQAGRNSDAEDYYKRAVRLRPHEATAHMNLGAILHFNNKWHEAEKSYLKALKLKPNDPVTEANLKKLRNLIRGVAEET